MDIFHLMDSIFYISLSLLELARVSYAARKSYWV